MKRIALNRLHIWSVPTNGTTLDNKQQLAIIAELAVLGYYFTNPAYLHKVSVNFWDDYQVLRKTLIAKKGGDVNYVPLFSNFPTQVPADSEYYQKRVLGYIANIWNLTEGATTLWNGTKVPQWLFDLQDFGADPITQMQSRDLWLTAIVEQQNKQADTHTEWHALTLVNEQEANERLKAYLQELVYAKSSIKEALHANLYDLLHGFGAESLDGSQIVFKETQALVLYQFWQQENWTAIAKLAKTATDVLRLLAAVTKSDISLSKTIKFPKLSRPARRAILMVLEGAPSLGEDLSRYKGLWLQIGRYLHPSEYAKQYPRTAHYFDLLRNGKIETFQSKTEALLAQKEIYLLLEHLNKKPTLFARKLHEVLRKFPEQLDIILFAFAEKIQQIPLKNLLILNRYFDTINEASHRAIINKKGKMKVLKNSTFGALTDLELHKTMQVLQTAIRDQLATKETWEAETVWIDERLQNYTVPLQQRKASDGILTVGRGSRVEADFDKVLRLFVYWKQTEKRTDLDLSVIQYDADMLYLGHVSYTNLKDGGIVHSGDIQSAPEGAAEFIDITLTALRPEVKYLAVQVYKYAGESFVEMDCHAGWMWRKEVDSNYRSFDIKTVANKFDLNGVGSYAIPLLVDMAQQQIVSTDLYVGDKQLYSNVEKTKSDVALMCSELVQFTTKKPVMQHLVQQHALARGATLVAEKEAATLTFGLTDCTYNVQEVEKILSELI